MGIESTSRPLRVANIIEEGKLGGPQIRIARVAADLKGIVDTVVIMPHENSEAFRKLLDEGCVPYKTFWMSRITKEWSVALRYLLFFPYELIRLTYYFRKEKFDLIHVSGGSWQYKGLLAGKLAGIKIIWHLNDTMMPLMFRIIFGFLGKYADSCIYASERTRTYYKKYCDESKGWSVIPAPVDTEKFSPDVNVQLDYDIDQLWLGKMVVGMVANINPIKGVDVFVEVARVIGGSISDVIFVVVGPVHKNQLDYFKVVKEANTSESVDNIVFLGGREDVIPLLKRFDVYVCASRAESSPISVWEAMSMGKPIVSTNVGDVPLYVKDYINGYIVPVDDSQALGNRITALLQEPNMRSEFGRLSREIAINELDVSICSKRHMDAYHSVL
jgi:glycosyltransferase involved in cell wall biosynthesis